MVRAPAIHDGRSRLVKRFWAKVEKSDGCWHWRGSKSAGYGQIPLKAHEFAYELLKGEISEKLVVMHTCDDKACVNPAHLVLGTTAENVRDGIRKGLRSSPPIMRGATNPNAKLDDAKVRELRERYHVAAISRNVFVDNRTGKRVGSRQIGTDNGVSKALIERVLGNRTYQGGR